MVKLLNREMVDVKSRDTLLKEASGPAMTVTSLDNFVGKLECTWFNVCESTYNYYTEDSLTLLTPKTSVQ